MTDDADIIIVAYGSVARSAMRAIKDARKLGIKAGLYRPITVWPFNEKRLRRYAKKCRHFLVPEMNMGQIVNEVKAALHDKNVRISQLNKANGELISPSEILNKLKGVVHV